MGEPYCSPMRCVGRPSIAVRSGSGASARTLRTRPNIGVTDGKLRADRCDRGTVGAVMRVPRTFAFIDLTGFTNYTAAYGDDAAGRILSAFRALVREIASERGVRIAKWLGDGFMMVSVDQQAAITFALDLEHRSAEVCAPLAVRVGIASGLRAAVRRRRLHRLGRQHGVSPVRPRRTVRGADADDADRASARGRRRPPVRRGRAARLPGHRSTSSS